MKEQIITVNSWAELQDALYTDSWASSLNRFRSSFVYRGLEDRRFDLSTSLNREGESHLERHLLRNFRKYSQIDDDKNKSIWNWMALAQHHGLPTRLLDWTYSPYVALHFVTADFDKYHLDGAIWAVNYVDAIGHLPDQLRVIIEEEGSHVFTAEMLDRAARSLEELATLKREDFAVFFEPPSIDQRIVNQYALFSMMSDPDTLLHSWLDKCSLRQFKILIPARLKWEIRDKLDQSNINERVLFPGLDGLAVWLKRHYKDIRRGQKKQDNGQPQTGTEQGLEAK
jgi:hypothetical protein